MLTFQNETIKNKLQFVSKNYLFEYFIIQKKAKEMVLVWIKINKTFIMFIWPKEKKRLLTHEVTGGR